VAKRKKYLVNGINILSFYRRGTFIRLYQRRQLSDEADVLGGCYR